MSDIRNAVTAERRRLVTRLLDWVKSHPRTLVVVAAMAVVVAVTFGLIRG
jgi:hypothetical protein